MYTKIVKSFRSEQVLGDILKDVPRSTYYIATKVQRERQRQRQRKRDRQTHRQADREKAIETERQTDIHKDRSLKIHFLHFNFFSGCFFQDFPI